MKNRTPLKRYLPVRATRYPGRQHVMGAALWSLTDGLVGLLTFGHYRGMGLLTYTNTQLRLTLERRIKEREES